MFTGVKGGLILQIYCCRFMAKMRMRTDFYMYVLFILQRQAYCLGLRLYAYARSH